MGWRRHIKKATAAVLVAAAVSVAGYEGLRTSPYLDVVGVRTVCFGETAADHVNTNRDYTPAECRKMLNASLKKYDAKMVKCLYHTIPPSMQIAFISATYNIGVYAFCHSSMARRVNAGDLRGACNALLMWDKGVVHGRRRVVKGLKRRRESERKICLRDLGG